MLHLEKLAVRFLRRIQLPSSSQYSSFNGCCCWKHAQGTTTACVRSITPTRAAPRSVLAGYQWGRLNTYVSTLCTHAFKITTGGADARHTNTIVNAAFTCMSVVFRTSISAGDSSWAPAPSAANACWHATAGEKAISNAAAVLTTVFLKLSAFGNGDAPIRMGDAVSRAVLALLLLLRTACGGVTQQRASGIKIDDMFTDRKAMGVRAADVRTCDPVGLESNSIAERASTSS